MPAPDDHQPKADLIERARQGDPEAIGQLYETHHLNVFRYLYYRSGDTQVAEDLTSEVFLRMIRAVGGYRTQEATFQAWLFQIAHNLLNDHYRKTNGMNHIELEDDLMDTPERTEPRPIEQTLNAVTLRTAIEQLSGEQRDVIVMRFVTGLPIAQVAQALNKSEDAVKGLQRRALSNLRSVLTEQEIHYA